MMYLFAQSLAPTIPASFLTFGHTLLYPVYGTFPRIWGISALNDQLIAGLEMKLVGGFILWGFVATIFFRWHAREERDGWDALALRPEERELRIEGAAMRPVLRDRLVMPILLPLGILAVIAAVLFGFSRILLSLTPTAATVTAIVVASGVVITAAVAAGRKQVRLSTLGAMLGVTAGVAMLAGGVALAVVGGNEEEPGGGGEKPVVTLAAANIAFEPTSLTVPAGEAFTLQFHNQDANTQHNVQIFDDPKFAGTPLFSGALVTGVRQTDYEVDPLEAGAYFFHCEVHPTMTGKMQAVPSGGGAWGDRSGRSRGRRRRDGRGPEPRVRHRHDRARAGADDDHVREPRRGRAAQHRDLLGQLARRRAVQRGAGHRARDRGVRRPRAAAGRALLPVQRPPEHERHRRGLGHGGVGAAVRRPTGPTGPS